MVEAIVDARADDVADDALGDPDAGNDDENQDVIGAAIGGGEADVGSEVCDGFGEPGNDLSKNFCHFTLSFCKVRAERIFKLYHRFAKE